MQHDIGIAARSTPAVRYLSTALRVAVRDLSTARCVSYNMPVPDIAYGSPRQIAYAMLVRYAGTHLVQTPRSVAWPYAMSVPDIA
eukprot:1090014-Rhodomonas_salina.2